MGRRRIHPVDPNKRVKLIKSSPPEDIRQFMRDNIDWLSKLETLNKLADGKFEVVDKNGQATKLPPDMKAMTLLFEYSWGKPITIDSLVDTQQLALHKLAQVLVTVALPNVGKI